MIEGGGLRYLRASNLATSPRHPLRPRPRLRFIPPMPKVVAPRKGALAEGTVKFKTVNRGRNKAGRPTATTVKSSVEPLPPKSQPTLAPSSVIPDLDPRDSESEGEQEIQLPAQKGRSRAVSVSPGFSRVAHSH